MSQFRNVIGSLPAVCSRQPIRPISRSPHHPKPYQWISTRSGESGVGPNLPCGSTKQ